jgi:hypothetical protein
MLIPLGTAGVYRREIFWHGIAKKKAVLDLFSSFGRHNAK